MRAGQFQGFNSIGQLHRDTVHLNSVGQNVAPILAFVPTVHRGAAEWADRVAAAPEALDGRRLGRSDFDTACDRAAALGAEVKAERDACWLCFAELRGEYEAFLSSLADSLLVSVHDSLLLPLAASAHAASAAALVQSPTA